MIVSAYENFGYSCRVGQTKGKLVELGFLVGAKSHFER